MTRQKDEKNNINKGLLILSTFDETSPMQRTTDIVAKLGMNMSTVSRHLNNLLDLGFLERDDATVSYTHLDVYKRQAGYYVPPEGQGRESAELIHERRSVCKGMSGSSYKADGRTEAADQTAG